MSMKRIVCAILSVLLVFSVFTVQASAVGSERKTITTVEYLDDGSYFVIEVTQSSPTARSSTTDGYKTATYYGGNGVAIWSVTVHGYFSYNGSSAKATSASASVAIFDSNASFVSKNAYVSGASAYGYGSVKYGVNTGGKNVILTCDRNGNLS